MSIFKIWRHKFTRFFQELDFLEYSETEVNVLIIEVLLWFQDFEIITSHIIYQNINTLIHWKKR